MPNVARRIHVSGSRSEPGNTRLSKDDGSMASKLPQIIYLKSVDLAKKSKKVEILVDLRPILGAKAYRELDHISR